MSSKMKWSWLYPPLPGNDWQLIFRIIYCPKILDWNNYHGDNSSHKINNRNQHPSIRVSEHDSLLILPKESSLQITIKPSHSVPIGNINWHLICILNEIWWQYSRESGRLTLGSILSKQRAQTANSCFHASRNWSSML